MCSILSPFQTSKILYSWVGIEIAGRYSSQSILYAYLIKENHWSVSNCFYVCLPGLINDFDRPFNKVLCQHKKCKMFIKHFRLFKLCAGEPQTHNDALPHANMQIYTNKCWVFSSLCFSVSSVIRLTASSDALKSLERAWNVRISHTVCSNCHCNLITITYYLMLLTHTLRLMGACTAYTLTAVMQ